MSDEFIRVATKEINEELSYISDIIKTSTNDAGIESNSDSLEKHLHKIKGLAPMMGKEDVGRISSIIDSMMKKILAGKKIPGIYQIASEANTVMEKSMGDIECNSKAFADSLGQRFKEFE